MWLNYVKSCITTEYKVFNTLKTLKSLLGLKKKKQLVFFNQKGEKASEFFRVLCMSFLGSNASEKNKNCLIFR